MYKFLIEKAKFEEGETLKFCLKRVSFYEQVAENGVG